MSSTLENQILNLQERLRAENQSRDKDKQQNTEMNSEPTSIQTTSTTSSSSTPSPIIRRPEQLGDMGTPTRIRRQLDLPVSHMQPMKRHDTEFEAKLQEIMKMSGILNISGTKYETRMDDLEHLGELGNGTCGHVVKMKHKPSGVIIAVKQMRRSGNNEENKRIIMDIDVVLKSHDCPYIVQCLGCFITESDVWICMELMTTCLDKLLKRVKQPIPEDFLGKVTLATVKALSYLKEKHGVIHRDVKPSNILLDERGGVKLCDFGISGRLVDSKAKTRSAGCAAYMAPERIDPPDPSKPDYDIRADVWSLGITLVELATGVFPYRDCKTDFEVLSRVVQDDPPSLPPDKTFSNEFREFVKCCLTKNYKHRPKYHKLMEHPFIKKYELQQNTNSLLPASDCQWFYKVMRQFEPRYIEGNQRSTSHVSLKQTLQAKSYYDCTSPAKSTSRNNFNSNSVSYNQHNTSYDIHNYGNTYGYYSPYALRRRDYFRSFSPASMKFLGNSSNNLQRSYSPYRQALEHNKDQDTYHSLNNGECQTRSDSPFRSLEESKSRSQSPFYEHTVGRSNKDCWNRTPRTSSHYTRDYSPWRRENVDPPGVVQIPPSPRLHSHSSQLGTCPKAMQHLTQETNISDSPAAVRRRFPSELPLQGAPCCNPSSPQLYISRFTHQLKQDPLPNTSENQLNGKDSTKKRFTSYVRHRLGSDRSASPDPPPRLNRGESPLIIRRTFGEQASPLFPKRYISPTPPVPPPRRLSESSSVPGSPQHFFNRFHFTPELQRRLPQP